MSADDKNDIFLEMLTTIANKVDKTHDSIHELDSKVNNLDKKLDLHIQETKFELSKINDLDTRQNEILDEHVAGVNTLKSMHELQKKEYNARFEKLERPREWLKFTAKIVTWAGGIATALYGILKFYKGM